jgi:uncharacterized protein YceK
MKAIKYLVVIAVVIGLSGCASSMFGNSDSSDYQNTQAFKSKIKIQ